MLIIRGLSKIYSVKGRNPVKALDNIDMELPDKGFIFINGISGSGKTTLMNILAGLDAPTSGSVCWNEDVLTDYKENVWDNYRNLCAGIVFQSFNLVENMTVAENILLPLKIQNVSSEAYMELVLRTLEYVDLAGYEERKAGELSAGQKQRVAIARAIIKSPRVILADEATGNLDQLNTDLIMKLFDRISKHCLVLLISHDAISAQKYGDRIITLSNGRIVNDVDNQKIKSLTLNPYTVNVSRASGQDQMPLEQFDIKEELAKHAQWNGAVCEPVTLALKIEPKLNDKAAQGAEIWSSEKKQAKHLPISDIFENVILHLGKSRLRMALIILLIACICAIFQIADIVVYNDFAASIQKYFSGTEYSCAVVERRVVYEMQDSAAEMTLYKGVNFLNSLISDAGEEYIIKCIGDQYFYDEDNDEGNVISTKLLIYEDNALFRNEQVEGIWPTGDNQLVLDIGTAVSLGVDIGDTVIIDGSECVLVGLCDMKLTKGDTYAVVSSNVPGENIRCMESVNLQGVDITKSTDKTTYAYSICTLGRVSVLNNQELLWGRYPQSEQEVLISSVLAEELGYGENGSIVTKYRLPDLHDNQYQNIYDGIINLFDYLGKNVEIVGIYDAELCAETAGRILLNDNVYEHILADYLEMLNYESCLIYLKSGNPGIIRRLYDDHFYIVDGVCEYIYTLANVTNQVKDYLAIVIGVLCMMIAIVLISFLMYHVKDHSKKIGIFRAIGMETRDIYSIFLIETAVICGVSLVLSVLMMTLSINLINGRIQSMIDEGYFEMFTIHYFRSMVICTLIFIFGMLVTVHPLRKMAKDKSINLISCDV